MYHSFKGDMSKSSLDFWLWLFRYCSQYKIKPKINQFMIFQNLFFTIFIEQGKKLWNWEEIYSGSNNWSNLLDLVNPWYDCLFLWAHFYSRTRTREIEVGWGKWPFTWPRNAKKRVCPSTQWRKNAWKSTHQKDIYESSIFWQWWWWFTSKIKRWEDSQSNR